MTRTTFLVFLGAFLAAMVALVLIVMMLNSNMNGMGFEPKEELARKINEKLGGIHTRDLRYDDFIKKFPEGDNALYTDIKKLDIIDMPGLLSIL